MLGLQARDSDFVARSSDISDELDGPVLFGLGVGEYVASASMLADWCCWSNVQAGSGNLK